MSILSSRDWSGASIDRRVIERSVKRCSVGDVREWTPEPGEAGEAAKGPEETVLVNLTLEEPARTVDGDEVRPGFPVTARINVWRDRREEANAKVKELAVAALGLDRKTKDDVGALLESAGGWPGLKGKHVMVTFDTRKDKRNGGLFQEVLRYDRVPQA